MHRLISALLLPSVNGSRNFSVTLFIFGRFSNRNENIFAVGIVQFSDAIKARVCAVFNRPPVSCTRADSDETRAKPGWWDRLRITTMRAYYWVRMVGNGQINYAVVLLAK